MTAVDATLRLAHLQPLTAVEYSALPEDFARNYELQDGHLVVSATRTPDHQNAVAELAVQLRDQAPGHLRPLYRVDIDLELAPPAEPGTVRAPDIAVVTQDAFLRVRHEGGFLRATECVLAVEIHSYSTRRTDQVVKRAEYADAGIGHYWMVDLLSGPSLTACHSGGPFGYVDEGPFRGTFTVRHPFPVHVDLAALV